MNYRSVEGLVHQSRKLASLLPSDIEVVVGIPRSGLLVANLIALYRNLPLTDVHSFLNGRLLYAGERLRDIEFDTFLSTPRKVVVIDDSLHSGTQMNFVKQQLDSMNVLHHIVFAAVFIEPGKEDLVDHYSEVVKSPRCFEWNIMHHSLLQQSCVDIDGVLCRDPTNEENDDGPLYERFLSEVEPKNIPSQEIGWLVTCRLEKYREITEYWLKEQGIKYRSLIMMNYPDKETRIRSGSHSSFKASHYESTGAHLFIESSKHQAVEIARITRKPVFCAETWEMIQEQGNLYKLRLLMYRTRKRIFGRVKQRVQNFLG